MDNGSDLLDAIIINRVLLRVLVDIVGLSSVYLLPEIADFASLT